MPHFNGLFMMQFHLPRRTISGNMMQTVTPELASDISSHRRREPYAIPVHPNGSMVQYP
jgi:hypothetical protein